jgi:pantetheine-phosphate adenylyltransferase
LKTAIYPGSFDPVTLGHMDIVERAANLFDKLIVLVSVNPTKPSSFTLEERVVFLKKCTSHIPNVEIDSFNGLLVDYFKQKNADVIVKGLRAMSDFEYEFQMAMVNKDLSRKAETVFLTASPSCTFLSSSVVKQVAVFGGDVSAFVPSCVLDDIVERLKKHTDLKERK